MSPGLTPDKRIDAPAAIKVYANARTCGKADYPTRIILGDHRSSFAFACYLSKKDYRKSPSIQSGLTQRVKTIDNNLEGLARAIREALADAAWQRCVAHLERNVRDRCRRRDVGDAAVAALKAALSERDPALVRAGYREACDLLAAVDPRGAELLEEAGPSVLAYLDFPRKHAVWVRTNNVQERMNCEIKRRTRVVQVFPSFDSLVRLVGAVSCDQNDAWLSSRNFIDARSLAPGYKREPVDVQ